MSDDLLIHVGHGEDRKTYTFNPGKLLNVEAIAIEKATGLALGPLLDGLSVKSVLSINGILWVLRKREEPRLQYGEVLFSIEDVNLEDPDEVEVPAAPKAVKKAAKKS